MMLADVHCHLAPDPAASLARARSAGVDVVLAAGTDVASSRVNAALAEKYGQVKACAGVHPWRADLFTPEAEEALTALLRSGKITAISETGIDRARRLSGDFRTELPPLPLERQIEAFRAQVRLAASFGVLLVLHDRGATEEIIRVLDGFPDVRGIVHGFGGTLAEARRYLDRGFLISVNQRNLPGIDPVVEALSLADMVLETDSDEPAQVVEAAQAVASLKKVTRDQVAQATTANVGRLLQSKN